MKSIIVGTAGHIDHGKTRLVKALTGIDTDRLAEEKRRGITIDLGFAHLELPGPKQDTLRFGFVDVPGHERFIRNMLAGAGGIDLVLLVIAADEGIKPQTREHFEICRLLSIKRGITVVSKRDLVDSDTLAVLRLEIEDFLRGSFLEGAPIVPVSAIEGTGCNELKHELVEIASQIPARDINALARLPIDRVFTMKGFGTVVTGTLISGTIAKDEELELFPARRRVRGRGIQVHGRLTDRARAGERTAVNLVGVDKSELKRGTVLASPGLLQTSSEIDVRLALLASAKPLKIGTRVAFHAFSSETIASIGYFDRRQLEAGEEAWARLRLRDPQLLLPNDRFIVRQLSPAATIGGGIVIDNLPLRQTSATARLQFLAALAAGDLKSSLQERIRRAAGAGSSLAELAAATGESRNVLEHALAELISERKIAGRGDRLVDGEVLGRLVESVVKLVEEFQARDPLAPGIGKESLREKAHLSPEVLDIALGLAVAAKRLAISGDLVHLPGRGVVMKDEEAQSRDVIEQAFRSAGLKVPSLKQVLGGLRIDGRRAEKIVTLLLRDKVLIKVSDDLVFHHAALAELRASLALTKARSPRIGVAAFKDLAGISRKYAIPLLEYLDRERVTRREGDERLIL